MRYFIIIIVLLLMTSAVHAECSPGDEVIQGPIITHTDPETGEVTREILKSCRFTGNALDALTEKLEKKPPKSSDIYAVFRCGIDDGGGVVAACKLDF